MSTFRKVAGAALLAGLIATTAVVPAVAGHGHRQNVKFVTLAATLSGASEIPGPGDSDGTGVAEINVAARSGALCFAIAVESITLPAAAAHIHVGAVGVAGDIVVTLEPPVGFGSGATGVSAGCLTGLRGSLLKDIANNPSAYYVNVHNGDFPAGAVRGQLAAA